MTKFQRAKNFIKGLLMLAAGGLVLFIPGDSYLLLLTFLALVLLFSGINTLIYYFTMARFMTGGKIMLYKGIIVLNFSILTASLVDVPRIYVLMYLIAIHAFSGLVEILRALEAKRYGGGRSWHLKLGHGLLNLGMCILCCIFIKHVKTVSIIYAMGIIYSAILTIAAAFRKSDLVYIQ
ncbi:hypothetical protein D6855_07550 [Butyrivibrio sp. CB08]|uniref:DUF308 domain-containing protein n=1 Tax=Butyrivibrio sp. CB08 TaxID=2364879 RepID=UPI000EA8DE7F|nr:DUF308 domain-containing protein [Butyrivibrio sp. CB08]RKM60554.1 hypothetical protein D6855_07550 [Butyrivibrio sp. CB08]